MAKEEKIGSGIVTSGKVKFFVIFFIRLMLLLSFLGAWYRGRSLILFVSALALLVTFLPGFLEKYFEITIPADFEIIVILFIYGSLFLGEIRGFYAEFWWWDIFLNLGTAIALGFVGLTILYVLYKDDMLDASPLIIGVFTFCFAVAMGTMWELFEFFMDGVFKFNLQKTGLIDTMWDLASNAIGAFLVSITGYYYIKYGEGNIASSFIIDFIDRHPGFFRSKSGGDQNLRIKKILDKGEGEKVEFKSTFRRNLHTGELDKNMEHGILKTIVAYLNSGGGVLLVGVNDEGEIIGLEKEGFASYDKLNLHLTNLIKNGVGVEFLPFIKFDLIDIEEKKILKVNCSKSNKEVFLKNGKNEEFYVRNGPSSVRLTGRELVEYVERRFKIA
jgi:hypothetical protein